MKWIFTQTSCASVHLTRLVWSLQKANSTDLFTTLWHILRFRAMCFREVSIRVAGEPRREWKLLLLQTISSLVHIQLSMEFKWTRELWVKSTLFSCSILDFSKNWKFHQVSDTLKGAGLRTITPKGQSDTIPSRGPNNLLRNYSTLQLLLAGMAGDGKVLRDPYPFSQPVPIRSGNPSDRIGLQKHRINPDRIRLTIRSDPKSDGLIRRITDRIGINIVNIQKSTKTEKTFN